MTALEDLLQLAQAPDPIMAADDFTPEALVQLQLAAADERLQEMRKVVPILEQRAGDVGVNTVRELDDLVPLLFSHTTYKSYPESFVTKGQWRHLLTWFGTVSATSMENVDLDGVQDIDEWAARLADAGHFVFGSSGTSGKSSFIDQTQRDVDRIAEHATRIWGWPHPPSRDKRRPIFSLTPSQGPAKLAYLCKAQINTYGRPDAIYTLTDDPIRMSEINEIMRLQEAMAAGRATPSQVAQFEENLADKADSMHERYLWLARALDAHRDEPITVLGCWPQHWSLLEACEELGISGGGFHPDGLFFGGGGTKGLALPDDYQDVTRSFFADMNVYTCYGMSELSTQSPMCESGRFHVPPWMTLLVLDETGEHRRDGGSGTVTGRSAFFDPVWESHWGGLITGDWITADYGRCECGRPGPTVENSVRRARDVIGIEDDKISCAGAVEAYIRGAIKTSVDRFE